MSSKAKSKEIAVGVTEEEYQADLAKGLKEDEILKPGRHKFRRGGFLSRHGLKPADSASPIKVRISINLDLDVLEYFKQRAAAPNAAPYQTQINYTLREAMEKEKQSSTRAMSIQAEELLSDQRFIEAVAKKIWAKSVPTGKTIRRVTKERRTKI
jgi:uncharacterized protein (DUF4415 family)